LRRRLVVLESPFAGEVEKNIKYAREAVRDSLLRGESPVASHLLYTQEGILNDDIPEERKLGIDAGLEWSAVSDGSVVYIDRGISRGMNYGIIHALGNKKPVHFRSLQGEFITMELLASLGLGADVQRLLSPTPEISPLGTLFPRKE